MKQLCVGRYGGRQAVNGVHIVHPKFPFLTEFISLCFYCLTEMLGYNSSHLCLRYRCQWLSYPIPVRPNESIINAVSGRDFSDQRQAGIITQTALAIPDGSVHSLWGGGPAWPAGLCTCLAHSHNVSDSFSPHTHYMCHPPKSKWGWKLYPENYSYSQFHSDRFRAMLKPCSKPQLNPKGTNIRCVTHKIWGYNAQRSYFRLKGSCELQYLSYYVFILSGTLQ